MPSISSVVPSRRLGRPHSRSIVRRFGGAISGGTIASPRKTIQTVTQRLSFRIEEAKVQRHTFASFMMLLFLILPVIAKRVCQSFRCVSFDGGDNEVHTYLAVSAWVGLEVGLDG